MRLPSASATVAIGLPAPTSRTSCQALVAVPSEPMARIGLRDSV
jgi:hypothetical protein